MKVLIINPRCAHPSYYTLESFEASGLQPATLIADLTIATLAAMVPYDFSVTIHDENIAPLPLEEEPDYVLLTGKVSQWPRMVEVAQHFRKSGVCVLIGGPHASLSPDVVRPHCDILVCGEIEEIAETLFNDLRSGDWKSKYVGTKPGLTDSPVPRWDLYGNGRALVGTLQTSRGCPFDCEFCDVIEYLGRKQRHKEPAQVIKELEVLHKHGYRSVFLADDNFTVYRARARELLEAISGWNSARPRAQRLNFITQVSIDASRDTELLRACANAGLQHVFIGIETPNQESLAISGKRQNLKCDLAAQITAFVRNGISVDGGMIVGFDGDRDSIFQIQYEFAMRCPVPVFTLGALVAPAATRLHKRLGMENRLVEGGPESNEIAASPWSTNILPMHMTREELFAGIRWLCNALYRPAAFAQRLGHVFEQFGQDYAPVLGDLEASRDIDGELLLIIGKLRRRGAAEAAMVSAIMNKLKQRPELTQITLFSLVRYFQIRFMYDQDGFWIESDAELAALDPRERAVSVAA